ncbi:MAG: hypothetical protein FGM54_05210 [Chitinophagaceae bacterium]|nr:hypothetical protein [Chitinophagaceae bacterium]
MMTHTFYKENRTWYIDLPDYLNAGLGTKDNLMMVAGADTFLDFVCRGKNRVVVDIDLNDFKGCQFMLEKKRIGMDKAYLDSIGHPEVEYGAYYNVKENNHQLWLCPVTEYVFGGEYPNEIYIRIHP